MGNGDSSKPSAFQCTTMLSLTTRHYSCNGVMESETTATYGEGSVDPLDTQEIGRGTRVLHSGTQIEYTACAAPDVTMNTLGGCTVFRHQSKVLTAINLELQQVGTAPE